MERFTVEKHNKVFYIQDNGWIGCDKKEYPKDALELRFKSSLRAEKICNMLNAEWQEFLNKPE